MWQLLKIFWKQFGFFFVFLFVCWFLLFQVEKKMRRAMEKDYFWFSLEKMVKTEIDGHASL